MGGAYQPPKSGHFTCCRSARQRHPRHRFRHHRAVISTFQALAVAALAVLPGALYTFAYERVVGAFGVQLADRVTRFLAASAVFLALLAGPIYLLYQKYVVTGLFGEGALNAGCVWAVSLLYVIIPWAAGAIVGKGTTRGWKWAVALTGSAPEPRAWERIWGRRPDALVRIRLKSGSWVGGVFATSPDGVHAYAGAFPSDGDLFLTGQLKVDPDTGECSTEEDGTPVVVQRGLWIRCSEIDYMDIQEF